MRARGEGRGGSCSFYFHSVYAVLAFLYAAGAGAAGRRGSTGNNRKKIGEGKNNEELGRKLGEGDRGGVSYVLSGLPGKIGAVFGAVGVGYSLRWEARASMYGKEWNWVR